MSLFPSLNNNSSQKSDSQGNNILFSARVKDILLSNEQKIFQKTMAKESLASLKGINSHLNHFFIISTSPTMN